MSEQTIRQRKALHRYPAKAFYEAMQCVAGLGFVITVCCLIVLGWRA